MEQKNNGRSLGALVLGILAVVLSGISIFVFWWLGYIGALLGTIGLFIGAGQDSKAGFITAAIGVVVGLISATIMLIVLKFMGAL